MRVARADFEQGVAEVEREVADPRSGICGPDSVSWRVGRESALFVGAGAASLLQLAHPYVAQALAEHSRTQADPMMRFQRTFFHVYRVSFGDLGHAVTSSRQIFSIHERVHGVLGEELGRFPKGHAYEALDPEALYWVYATLVHGALQAFELFVRPMSDAERDGYVTESHRFARLFGVPRSMLPGTHAEFLRQWSDWLDSDRLAVGTVARDIAHFLLHPPRAIPRAIGLSYRPLTRALLPPRFRNAFGPASRADALVLRSVAAMARTLYPTLPTRVRYVPAYHDANRRLAGLTSRDAVSHWIHRRALKVVLGPG